MGHQNDMFGEGGTASNRAMDQTDTEVLRRGKRPAEKSHSSSSKCRRNSLEMPFIDSSLSAFHLSTASSPRNQSRREFAAIGVDSETTREWHHGDLIPVLPGQLYFTCHENEEQTRRAISGNPKLFFFSSDFQELYRPLSQDFGPVNVDVTDAFIKLVQERISHPRLQNRTLVYYSYAEPEYCTNAAFLLASYLLVQHSYSPHAAAAVFSGFRNAPFQAFTDSGVPAPSLFTLSLFDCLSALAQARSLGWFSPGSPSPGHTRITGPLPGPDSNLKPGHNANRDPHATAQAPADQHHVTHEGEATTARDVQVEAAGQPAGGPEGAGESASDSDSEVGPGSGAIKLKLDMTLVCDKFVAFRGPVDHSRRSSGCRQGGCSALPVDQDQLEVAGGPGHPGRGKCPECQCPLRHGPGPPAAASASASHGAHSSSSEGHEASARAERGLGGGEGAGAKGQGGLRLRTATAAEYARALVAAGVSTVVRLNLNVAAGPGASASGSSASGPGPAREGYDRSVFTARGLAHYDLPFPDCTPPPPGVVVAFFRLCHRAQLERPGSRIAVHCHAGLGRTGTLIALDLMRRQHLSARQAIAWLRLVRPGSVIGNQQHFLESCERRGWCSQDYDHILNPFLHVGTEGHDASPVSSCLADSAPRAQGPGSASDNLNVHAGGPELSTWAGVEESRARNAPPAWMLLLEAYDEVRLAQPGSPSLAHASLALAAPAQGPGPRRDSGSDLNLKMPKLEADRVNAMVDWQCGRDSEARSEHGRAPDRGGKGGGKGEGGGGEGGGGKEGWLAVATMSLTVAGGGEGGLGGGDGGEGGREGGSDSAGLNEAAALVA